MRFVISALSFVGTSVHKSQQDSERLFDTFALIDETDNCIEAPKCWSVHPIPDRSFCVHDVALWAIFGSGWRFEDAAAKMHKEPRRI